MKSYLLVAGIVILAACSKTDLNKGSESNSQQATTLQNCDFGLEESQFNMTKRETLHEDDIASSANGTSTTQATTAASAVILLDFDGHTVAGTSWNYGRGNFTCAPANMTAAERDIVIKRVALDYSPFSVVVTTNESLYDAANATRRMRVVITESWEWYGQKVGGIAYVNSIKSGNNTPSFVFSSLLNYNSKNIAEAASHEAGHTMGLYHQASYDPGCLRLSSYYYGAGTGEIGWAPIMGVGYYQNLTTWHNGPTSSGCNVKQDEVTIISGVLGMKTDDHAGTITGASVLSSIRAGVINNSTDIDMFYLNLAVTKTITVAPGNAGNTNAGANVDLVLRIYRTNGSLITTVNDPLKLGAFIRLNPGKYYVSVGTVANSYAAVYGMLGDYRLTAY